MYELIRVSPLGFKYHDHYESLEETMRDAFTYAYCCDYSILGVIDLDTGEDCGNYNEYAKEKGWIKEMLEHRREWLR